MSVVPGDLKASLPKLPQQTDFAPPMAAMPATRVIALTNMFTDDDLKDDEAFHEINDDTKQECSRFGTVVSMYTPGMRVTTGAPRDDARRVRRKHAGPSGAAQI